MANYQIVCVNKSQPTTAGHHHIVQVGIGTAAGWSQLLSVADVYRLMNQAHRFHTVSPTTGKVAGVEPYFCCGIHTLRSTADKVTDNNLDNLNYCQVNR